jgi:hypothetical protein
MKKIVLIFVIFVVNLGSAYSFEYVVGGQMKQQDEVMYGATLMFWWNRFHFNVDAAFDSENISPGLSADFYIPLIEDFFKLGLAPGILFNMQAPVKAPEISDLSENSNVKLDFGIHLPLVFSIGLLIGSSSNNKYLGSFLLQVTPAVSFLFDEKNVSFVGFRGSSIIVGVTIGSDDNNYLYY